MNELNYGYIKQRAQHSNNTDESCPLLFVGLTSSEICACQLRLEAKGVVSLLFPEVFPPDVR